MRTVTVTIASSGRASLARTLRSLEAMDLAAGVAVDVVVADDSRDGAAARLVEAQGPWSLPIRVVPVGAGNVSHARNAALDAATGELIAMVDDDEWVSRDWLARMLAALDELGADCVFGPVFPVYPKEAPAWLVRADPLHVDWGRRGAVVSVGRSGNTLVKRAAIERAGVRFDPSLGRTGGEDTLFFNQLHRAGCRLVVTDDAVIREEVPAGRASLAYVRHRSLRKGQIYARFVSASPRQSRLGRAAFYAGAAVKAATAHALALAVRPFDRSRSLRLRLKAWLNEGKLRELLNLTPGEMS